MSSKKTLFHKRFCQRSETDSGGVQQQKMFLEISQNSQENTCVGASFVIKLHVGELREVIFNCELFATKSNSVTSYPIDPRKMFKFTNPNLFVTHVIVYKTIL